MEFYEPIKKAFAEFATPDIWGKPEATAEAVLKLVDSENPPLHFLLGKMAFPGVKKVYAERMEDFEAWKEVSANAHGH